MSAKLIVYLLLIFLLQNSGECSQASLSLNHEEISECVNCQCLTDIGNYVFAGSESVEEKPDIFQSKNCQSPDLPSPGNLMVASVIGGALTNAGSGGSLESCHDQWDILVERLSRRKYHKDCSTGGSSDELLARCGEDAYILSEYMDYRSHQSAAGNQLLSEAESDCKGVAVVFSAINILIRFENTAFLNNLVRSRALEDLIIKDDEDIEKGLYLLTQHSENFPQVQSSILNLRLSLLGEGFGKPRDVAALADRIQIMKDKTQLYGTHTSCESF